MMNAIYAIEWTAFNRENEKVNKKEQKQRKIHTRINKSAGSKTYFQYECNRKTAGKLSEKHHIKAKSLEY